MEDEIKSPKEYLISYINGGLLNVDADIERAMSIKK